MTSNGDKNMISFFIQNRSMKTFLLLIIVLSATFFPHFSFSSAQDCNTNNPPCKPTDPFPLHGHTDVARTITLSWICIDPDDDELVYDIYFDSKFPIKKQVSKQTNMTYDPGLLRYNTRYYWMVVAYDPCGSISISNIWTFVTEQNPNPHPPEIQEMTPSMNAKDIPIPATLSVTVFDEDNDLLKITFYDAKENTMIGEVNGVSLEPISLLWYDLKKNKEYTWYVTVSDPEFTITSETRSFKTYNHSAFPVAQFDYFPTQPKQYQLVTFNASESYDPDGSILEYQWDLTGNGTFTPWQINDSITNVYSMHGTYTITLKVKNNQGNIDTVHRTLYVSENENHPPNPPLPPIGPSTGTITTSYTFTTSTTDPDEDEIRYGWDFTGNDIIDEWTEFVQSGESVTLSRSYNSTGSYQIKVLAEDHHGLKSKFSREKIITITEENQSLCPYEPSDPLPKNNSTDVSVTDLNVTWNYTGPIDEHTFFTIFLNTSPDFDTPLEENLKVNYYLFSELKKDTTYYWKIIAKNQEYSCEKHSPIWQFTTTDFICPSRPIKPVPSNRETTVDPCSTILSWDSDSMHTDDLFYTVYFGESKESLTEITTRTQNTQVNPGILKYGTTYHWYVQITDDICSSVNSMEWSFTTKKNPCVASIQGPSETNSGDKVTFSASESRCDGGMISSYQWDFGDGTTATGETVTHTFRGNDTFKVRLVVTCTPDCITCSDSTIHQIRVSNTLPNKPVLVRNDILPFIGGQSQSTYSFTVKGNDPDGDSIRFRFDWGDNSSNTITDYVSPNEEVTVSHVWMNTGDYTIRIYAEDEHGAISAPLRFTVKMGSAAHIAMIIIATIGIVIVSVQVFFIILGHRKKMFQ